MDHSDKEQKTFNIIVFIVFYMNCIVYLLNESFKMLNLMIHFDTINTEYNLF